MGFRFYKRVRLGKGLEVHLSKSGITPSYRGKRGSLSSKGYSIRTGIPGLTYRKRLPKAGNSGCLVLMLFPLGLLLLGLSCSGGDASSGCRDTNCANYASQAAAQAAFEADPACRNDLDADRDGIACEEPGNSVKTCASTSNCGCSNKNKAPCEADPCCRWVVGEGCRCN